MYDVIILGSGSAGYTAAVYSCRAVKGSMMMVLPFLILKESCPSQLILTP